MMMKSNLWHFLGFLAILYLLYYMNEFECRVEEQGKIIKSQNDLIETQAIYIDEVNKMLGINNNTFYIYPKDNSPVHKGPI